MAKLQTVNQTCEELCIGRTKFYELIREGHLRSVLLGCRRLVLKESVERFLDKLLAENSEEKIFDPRLRLNAVDRDPAEKNSRKTFSPIPSTLGREPQRPL